LKSIHILKVLPFEKCYDLENIKKLQKKERKRQNKEKKWKYFMGRPIKGRASL
jgi:hypothetical protein